MKLILAPKNHLAEMFQSISVKFAYVVKEKDTYNTYRQIHTPVACRDFLGDCIGSRKKKKIVNIYNFNYSFKNTPFDTKILRLSITFPDNNIQTTFMSKAKDLNLFPGMKLYLFSTNHKDTIILETDKIWQSNVWKISLFTFYLKLCCYENIKDLKEPEKSYYNQFTPDVEALLLSHIKTRKEPLPDSIHETHNWSGWVSIMRNKNHIMRTIIK
jgi:hypothetical protein